VIVVLALLAAASLSGIVLDPQSLPVPAQAVTLTCGARTESATTDASGRFVFADISNAVGCYVDVARAGFALAREPLRRGQTDIVVRLRLAPLDDRVTVAAPKPVRPSLTGVELSDVDLRQFAGSTDDLIRYTRFLAGATTTPLVIYVDGMPRTTLPPMSMVAGISVNADLFSLEYADGDVTTIRIITRAPMRDFRIAPGTDMLGFGGGSPLASAAHASSSSGNVVMSGGVPRLPVTFIANASGGRTERDAPIEARVPASLAGDGRGNGLAPSTNRNGMGALDLYYAPAGAFRANVGYRELRSDASNVGAGGLVVREAALASTFANREIRANVTRYNGATAYEGGFAATFTDSSSRANSSGLGIVVGGDAIVGGSSTTAMEMARTRWTSKHVLRAMTDRPWSIGVVAEGGVDHHAATPNAYGTFQVDSADAYERAAAGEPVGTWFAMRGAGDARYSAVTVAPFAQKTFVRAANVEATGGVRADYHSDFGMFVSPRGSIAVRIGGFTIGGGAGLFATPVPDGVFMRAIENDGVHLQQMVASGVSLADTISLAGAYVPGVRTALASDLARPYQMMERVSIERTFGRFVPGFEATWTEDRRRLGLTRTIDGAIPDDGSRPGFVDTFESNRRGNRVRLHAQARYMVNRRSFSAHYEWVRARDNGDGPFAYATNPSNLDGDWGPSAGIAAHNVTVTGSFALPRGITLNATDTWHSGAPYTITTGLDPAGLGLFIDRGGLPRNGAEGPAYHSLSLYGHRRLAMPQAVARGRVHVNLGVQVDNLLDNTNYLGVGSVLRSSSFGQPLFAMPGRSVRVLINVD